MCLVMSVFYTFVAKFVQKSECYTDTLKKLHCILWKLLCFTLITCPF